MDSGKPNSHLWLALKDKLSPSLGRLTGGMAQVETSLGYIMSSRTVWATERETDPVSNKNNSRKRNEVS